MRLLKTLILVAGTAATLAFIPQAANAEKVCKEVCSAGVCRSQRPIIITDFDCPAFHTDYWSACRCVEHRRISLLSEDE